MQSYILFQEFYRIKHKCKIPAQAFQTTLKISALVQREWKPQTKQIRIYIVEYPPPHHNTLRLIKFIVKSKE